MSEMIDRAAEALFPRLDEAYPATMAEARAFVAIVIKAMREPTQAMIDAGSVFAEYAVKAAWEEMINAALKD